MAGVVSRQPLDVNLLISTLVVWVAVAVGVVYMIVYTGVTGVVFAFVVLVVGVSVWRRVLTGSGYTDRESIQSALTDVKAQLAILNEKVDSIRKTLEE
ncbi:MAG: hypothetical protein AT710_09425 [Thermocladium sp. ECH_B]|nr:MAG: hypothetical protein AT710_09425 [Thermocladium sp. ECH_B]